MRENDNFQMPLATLKSKHPRSRELEKISELLDTQKDLYERATRDLVGDRRRDRGRRGMTGEQVLRIGLLYMIFELTYEELAFHLDDSSAFRFFSPLPFGQPIRVSTLKNNLKRISEETWEAVNQHLVECACSRSIEKGRVIRTDCTVVETNIHEPTDSSLLWDCVRVLTRIMRRVRERFPEVAWRFHDHTRKAKKYAHQIAYPPHKESKRKQREQLYPKLVEVAGRVREYALAVLAKLKTVTPNGIMDAAFIGSAEHELREFIRSTETVLDQTRRRVIEGEKVPASEKIVSIFEKHTDIIIKKNREVLFGHKICLTGGRSSMILDVVIESGNPADSSMVERTIQRQTDLFGRPPKQACFDGGFASQENLQFAQNAGVEDVVFHKKCGLEESDMAKSKWVFRKLRKFRAGIEGCISTLKRAFKMGRCTWRGKGRFKSFIRASIAAFNAVTLARRLLT